MAVATWWEKIMAKSRSSGVKALNLTRLSMYITPTSFSLIIMGTQIIVLRRKFNMLSDSFNRGSFMALVDRSGALVRYTSLSTLRLISYSGLSRFCLSRFRAICTCRSPVVSSMSMINPRSALKRLITLSMVNSNILSISRRELIVLLISVTASIRFSYDFFEGCLISVIDNSPYRLHILLLIPL